MALTVPEESGGLGAGVFESTILAEAMGRRLVVEPFATTAVLAARIIERSDRSSRRDELLGAIAEGSLRVAVACLEPGRRYDLEPATTRARQASGGYVLDGTKLLVLDAPAAHKVIVSATIADGQGYGLFVVDRDQPGVTLRAYPLIDGRRAADIDFEGVRLEASALLCSAQASGEVLGEALDRLHVFLVADALGAMEATMEVTAEHIRNRKQFGKPLAAFQALQHRMAEMFVEVQETRSALYHALSHLDDEPDTRKAAVSSAVVVAFDGGRIVGGLGIQLHGGVGMTEEYQVGHYFKRLLVHEKSWGDVDFHLDRIAHSYR
jgi:alkylation response protein AidB-like acyl-CoA dehydrogenase